MRFLGLFFFLMLANIGHAQFLSFDFLSVEALIEDHKGVRSKLMARSGLEQANELLHKYSKEAAVEHDSLNVKLDKYTKCFDVIDVIYNSGVMVVNVRDTYNDVSDKISQLTTLIEDFMTLCTLRGNIVSSDTVIVCACRRCVDQVKDDGQQLKNSLVELAQYASGLRHITTEQLLTIIDNINECLDKGSICISFYINKLRVKRQKSETGYTGFDVKIRGQSIRKCSVPE